MINVTEKWYPILFKDVPAGVIFRTGPSFECVQYSKDKKSSPQANSSNGMIFSIFNSNERVWVRLGWHVHPLVHKTQCLHGKVLDRCIKCVHPPAATHPSKQKKFKKEKEVQAKGNITVRQMIKKLKGEGDGCKSRPEYTIRLATADGIFDVLSVYEDDEKKVVWIDIKGENANKAR